LKRFNKYASQKLLVDISQTFSAFVPFKLLMIERKIVEVSSSLPPIARFAVY